ncbi:MAG: bifunctional UDP-sugar hydrolase/5'-nucleotidase [Vampirovibrionales bacterium]|nr:bifunctional UDP-sugar hydrolase/5'-nucleotidase [Vampirovibrionales bacterium]
MPFRYAGRLKYSFQITRFKLALMPLLLCAFVNHVEVWADPSSEASQSEFYCSQTSFSAPLSSSRMMSSDATHQSSGSMAKADSPQAEQACITLFTLNDVYHVSAIDGGKRGGLGRVATLIKQLRLKHPNSMLILAGDTLAPSLESKLTEGAHMIDAWNALGVDLATLGNHEFDFGPAVLQQRVKESKFPWMIANVFYQERPFEGMPATVIREFSGVKVGFFGVLTPETLGISKAGPAVNITDPVEAAKKAVKKLKQQGADVIVAVTHLSLAEDILLAQQVSGIHVIVGGHEHTLIELLVGKVPIFKVGSDARNLGHIELTVNRKSKALDNIQWEIIPVTDAIAEDVTFDKMMARHQTTLNERFGKTVIETKTTLVGRQALVRTQETNLGNLIAEAYRTMHHADFGWINGGAIRANRDLVAGTITYKDIYDLLPFGNKVYRLNLSGKAIRTAFEYSFTQLGRYREPGGFLQQSGLLIEADMRLPEGHRITSLKLAKTGEPLQEDAMYTVALPDFIARGGNGYQLMDDETKAHMALQYDAALTDAETFAEYLEGLTSPLDIKADGRINITR